MESPTPNALHALRRGDIAGARELRLHGLNEFPREIFALADTLEILDLSGGALTSLPDDIGRLTRLRALFCSGNRFERLAAALGDCAALRQIGFRGSGLREIPGESLPPRLRWLTLTDNQIESLPEELGERPHLQKLMLAGNRLRHLPASLSHAASLELLRLSCNGFETLPGWLPSLPRLAWISWAGNPVETGQPSAHAAPIPWAHLEIGAILGEGASGKVHRAIWSVDAARRQPVALKMFRQAMTSDGLPEREMAACLAAGEHPNLTSAFGQLTNHPEGAQALVMPLLPAHWRALAGPPSLASCSRDVYPAELRLVPLSALQIAKNVAAAAAHLHGRGILHGDLYAHNTLWDGVAGAAVLSDFGAACMLPNADEGKAWRRVETRAWGLLFGELLDLCATKPAEVEKWRRLQGACVQSDPSARPLMDEIVESLDGFSPL
jgi:hypothetical protein